MPRTSRSITPDDILPLDRYETIRADKKQEAILRKRLTSLAVGPAATIIFESWDSMWLQIQEMLRIEKGGAAQLSDEIAAYSPLVPKGHELTATLFFEVPDPVARDAFLRTIGGVENHIALIVGGERLPARPEGDIARTRTRDNKASAVHFLRFAFTPGAVATWEQGDDPALVVIDHPNYGHQAVIGDETRAYLARECL